jgi:ribosome-associated protein
MNPIDLAQKAVFAALEKKADNPMIIDVRGISDIVDVHVVCAGDNDRQTRAISDAIQEICRAQYGLRPLAVEGEKAGQWILLDFGAMMVHVFLRDIRKHYNLETLWPKAKIVEVDFSQRPSRVAASEKVAPIVAKTPAKPVSKIVVKPVEKVAAKPLAAKTTAKPAAKPAAKSAPKKPS